MFKVHMKAGDRYGKWSIVEEIEPVRYTGATIRHFRCQCDCGFETEIAMTNLRGGASSKCRACVSNGIRDRKTAQAIYDAVKAGGTHREVAIAFDITKDVVGNIYRGRTWKGIDRW